MQELAINIIKNLPPECGQVLNETLNKQHERAVRGQQIRTMSIFASGKAVQLVNPNSKAVTSAHDFVSIVLGLYNWIVSEKYNISETALNSAGINFENFSKKIENNPNFSLISTSFGYLAGLAFAGPVGLLIGGGLGTIVAFLKKTIDHRVTEASIEAEAKEHEVYKLFTTSKKIDLIIQIFAFGCALYQCCDAIEQGKQVPDFNTLFKKEQLLASDKLRNLPVSIEIDKINNEEALIRELRKILD